MADDTVSLLKISGGELTISSVGGGSYPVTAFSFKLEHNGIPSISVVIDSAHAGEPENDAKRAEFSERLATYSGLSVDTVIRGGIVGSFTFSTEIGGAASDKEDLSISGWILTDVSLGSLSMSSAASAVITLTHPAILLQEDSLRLVGKEETSQYTGDMPSDVLAGIVSALEFIADTDVTGSLSDTGKELQTRSQQLASSIPEYLAWEGGAGWPVVGGEVGGKLHHSVLKELLSYNEMTPWHAIATGFAGRWALSITPTWDSPKLSIGPFNPWAPASYTIWDEDITQISLQSGGSRISGVLALDTPVNRATSSSRRWSSEDENTLGAEEGHFEPELAGTIKIIDLPSYIDGARTPAKRAMHAGRSYIESAKADYANSATSSAASAQPFMNGESSESFIVRYCKQMFCQAFFRDRYITITMRLAISLNILPGRTCELHNSAGVMIKFLVVAVEHMVDSNAGIAKTSISGMYAHTAEQVAPAGAVSGGTVSNNYIYE